MCSDMCMGVNGCLWVGGGADVVYGYFGAWAFNRFDMF